MRVPALLCRSDKRTPHKKTKPQAPGATASVSYTTLASAPAPAQPAFPMQGVGLLANLKRASPLPAAVMDDFARTAIAPCNADLTAHRHRMATITRHTADRWVAARALIQLMDPDMLAAREYSAHQRRSVFTRVAARGPAPGGSVGHVPRLERPRGSSCGQLRRQRSSCQQPNTSSVLLPARLPVTRWEVDCDGDGVPGRSSRTTSDQSATDLGVGDTAARRSKSRC